MARYSYNSIKMISSARPIIGVEEKKAAMDVLDSGMLIQGPKVRELEEGFAKHVGTTYAAAVNSGTAELHTALYAAGIKKGDDVAIHHLMKSIKELKYKK